MGKQKPNAKSRAYQAPNPHHHTINSGGYQATFRETRYVYHVSGLAGCLQQTSPDPTDYPEAYSVPFDVVIRRRLPIDGEPQMEQARIEVRAEVQEEFVKLMGKSAPRVDEISIRNVALLHTILVDADHPDGPAVRVFS